MLQSNVIHGDCLQVLPTLPAQSVNFVLTDPPYLVRYRGGRSMVNDNRRHTCWTQSQTSTVC